MLHVIKRMRRVHRCKSSVPALLSSYPFSRHYQEARSQIIDYLPQSGEARSNRVGLDSLCLYVSTRCSAVHLALSIRLAGALVFWIQRA